MPAGFAVSVMEFKGMSPPTVPLILTVPVVVTLSVKLVPPSIVLSNEMTPAALVVNATFGADNVTAPT